MPLFNDPLYRGSGQFAKLPGGNATTNPTDDSRPAVATDRTWADIVATRLRRTMEKAHTV